MITENILSLIPQAHPFVMVDNLLFVDDTISRTSLTIKKENILCEDDKLSEAGLLENMAQTAAAGNGYRAKKHNKIAAVGYIITVKKFEIFWLPEVNNLLLTEVLIVDSILNLTTISGKISCNNLLVAQCEMKVLIEPVN